MLYLLSGKEAFLRDEFLGQLKALMRRLPLGEHNIDEMAPPSSIRDVIAACEQCGRNRIPAIAVPVPWNDWLAGWKGAGILLVPGAHASLATLPRPPLPVALAIGPEGGFSEREIDAARSKAFHAVSLGPRVLRTETASVAALAALQTLWGDLR